MHISQLLYRLAEERAPRIVLSLRPQDVMPHWITHLVYASENGLGMIVGPKEDVFSHLTEKFEEAQRSSQSASQLTLVELREISRLLLERDALNTTRNAGVFIPSSHDTGKIQTPPLSRDAYEKYDVTPSGSQETNIPLGEPIVEMEGVRIAYGSSSILGSWQQSVSGMPKEGLWWTVRRGQRWGV